MTALIESHLVKWCKMLVLIWLSALGLLMSTRNVNATLIGPIGDNYDYTESDPDYQNWRPPPDMLQECDLAVFTATT